MGARRGTRLGNADRRGWSVRPEPRTRARPPRAPPPPPQTATRQRRPRHQIRVRASPASHPRHGKITRDLLLLAQRLISIETGLRLAWSTRLPPKPPVSRAFQRNDPPPPPALGRRPRARRRARRAGRAGQGQFQDLDDCRTCRRSSSKTNARSTRPASSRRAALLRSHPTRRRRRHPAPPPKQPKKQGIVYLGEETWDKVLQSANTHALISVDREYPYGKQHDAFKKAASLIADAGPSARALLAVGLPVSLGRPGFELNARLASRFGVKPKDGGAGEPEDLPRLFFLRAGAEGVESAEPYEGDREDGDAIARWAADRAGVFVGLKGQVRDLDVIGRRLLAALGAGEEETTGAETVDALLGEAKAAANGQPAELKEFVEYYVKALSRAAEKGKGKGNDGNEGKAWVASEEARLRRIAADASVADDKRKTMKWRANVLAGLLKPLGGGGGERGEAQQPGGKTEL